MPENLLNLMIPQNLREMAHNSPVVSARHHDHPTMAPFRSSWLFLLQCGKQSKENHISELPK
jgi:hypothetical protein